MSETFTIKRNDTSPAIRWELEDPDTNLVGASVVFNMKNTVTGALVIDRGAAEVVEGADRPTLGYNWAEGDTEVAGLYEAEFEITFSDESIETTPNSENIVVKVVVDLG